MKNQIKKISLFTAVVLTGVLLTFTSTSNAATFESTNGIIIEVVDLSNVTPDGGDALTPKCGSETESKTATKEGKCGEGKCGDDKSKESKTSATTATAKDTKTTDAGKCGEGKCGDDKSKESKTTTTSESKKKTSEGKCGEGKCGTD